MGWTWDWVSARSGGPCEDLRLALNGCNRKGVVEAAGLCSCYSADPLSVVGFCVGFKLPGRVHVAAWTTGLLLVPRFQLASGGQPLYLYDWPVASTSFQLVCCHPGVD
jgi:hypothetical protein